MIREYRYTVLKNKDIIHSLDRKEIMQLGKILDKINLFRKKRGKEKIDCVVVEDDWPMYNDVWKMIEEEVDGKRM